MNRNYRFVLISVVCGLGVCLLILGTQMSSSYARAQATAAATQAAAGNIERGRFIATVGGCGNCHGAFNLATPGQPPPLAGGREFDLGPLGIYYAPNLTNLQSMDLETFDMALRQGIAPYTDRVMAPVMPYNAFHGMSDSDVAALLAYLQTLIPVTNSVKQSVPGSAAANLESPPAKSMPSPQINTSAQYGGYIVDSVAYCGQCHSPTDATGAVIKGRELAGGNQNLGMQQQQLFASPIIGSALTATGYTRETFIALFRTGKRPWGAGLPFQMPWRQYGVMSDNDLTAVWNYLQTKRLPGPWPVAPAASTRAATAAATRAARAAAPAAATTAPTAGPVATQSR